LYEQGRYVEAAALLLELLAHRPGDSTAMALLARAYANQGKLEEALKWCERAITADRLDAGLHYLHATVLQACPLCPCAWPQDRLATGQAGGQARERGVVADAVASLKRALYLDPNLVLAHFALGNLALGQGKIKEANRHFTNVLSLLSAYRPEDILPESEGMTAGRLEKIVRYIVS
jgi:chemotaxis protein methyltransferase CheR